MSADNRSRWAAAHPSVSVEPSDPDGLEDGPYDSLLYVLTLSTQNSIEGILRSTECGITAVAAHRLVYISRSDYYNARHISVLDSLFMCADNSLPPADLLPSREIRGDSIALEFECENRHRWFLEIGNHKGLVIAALSPGELGAPGLIDTE